MGGKRPVLGQMDGIEYRWIAGFRYPTFRSNSHRFFTMTIGFDVELSMCSLSRRERVFGSYSEDGDSWAATPFFKINQAKNFQISTDFTSAGWEHERHF
ncbi:hypothetical protein AVEN_123770-1 [Araneus ventricosus]|uniref:Uncharacterized protein n=1 Tax=Araneus ventricosus TaxID=182803 RepID=A0A4Y2BJZ8_ARAVE|nr:hypothetical protein AVEN_123770-1 [Araneus ventricosus]